MSETTKSGGGSDVLVIGGGVIGLSIAYFLRRSGAEVRIVERGRCGMETSWGNCGLLTPSHADPLTQPASLKTAVTSLLDPGAPLRIAPTASPKRIGWLLGFARHCREGHRRRAQVARSALLMSTRNLVVEEFGDRGDSFCWSENGLTTIFQREKHLRSSVHGHERMRELGVEFTVLEGDELRRREPLVNARAVGAIHTLVDAHLEPGAFCEQLAGACRSAGVEITEGVEVRSLLVDGNRVKGAHTDQGSVESAVTVLAAGPWATDLAASAGVGLPIEPAKGYSITWPQPISQMNSPLYFYEPKVVATPWANGFRLGSTMEFSGYDDSLNPRRIGLLIEGARAFLDHPLDLGPGLEWSGWRPMSVDEVPIIGPSSRLRGLQLACGHGVLGVSQSLGTGKLMSELIGGGEPHIDAEPFSPQRFRA